MLRIVFLLLLTITTICMMALPLPKAKKTKLSPLFAIATTLSLIAILAYQATWQLAGFRHHAFMAFMRRHNPRPDAAEKQVKRGTIYDINGVKLASSIDNDPNQRLYPLGPAAAHVVGYAHPFYGLAGVERAANASLTGAALTTRREREQFGRNLLARTEAEGLYQALTIDARLQQHAYDLLANRPGAVVAITPKGAIRVLVSSPSFDPTNPIPSGKDQARMLNRALQGRYPPGSTFKIAIALMAAAQRLAPTYDCPAQGFYAAPHTSPIRDSTYWEYKRRNETWAGYGRLGLADAFARSSNVYFAQLGLACGAERFNIMAEAAHINERIPIFSSSDSTISSAAGNLKQLAPKQRAAIAQHAIGQGTLLMTPLHVAMLTAAVAAKGELWQPYLNARSEPLLMNRLATPAAAATVAALMRQTVTSGTGRNANIPDFEVCGKTGTAEVSGSPDHAWFTCFVPYHNPQLIITVIIEHGGFGATSALPVARDLLQQAIQLGLVTNPSHSTP
ncbi:MAG: penicillin-binding protein 2 [Lentisphaerae bacterium]|nr:penicillin-binding protein 2 [Lentisphaerota bacterium]